ncbi:hypothetical protein [Clostridium sp. UBA4548]|uniref:hypothetical protein n=1 Tax=Clostridium sp. UBA4548 TaxID=1946361 RepID=UPI0025C14AB2|nr:hypothetical protein [Clostridium sp. UBA4548]
MNLKDKTSRTKVTIFNKKGLEKEVDIGAYDETKPWVNIKNGIEDTIYDEKEGKETLNTFEEIIKA